MSGEHQVRQFKWAEHTLLRVLRAGKHKIQSLSNSEISGNKYN